MSSTRSVLKITDTLISRPAEIPGGGASIDTVRTGLPSISLTGERAMTPADRLAAEWASEKATPTRTASEADSATTMDVPVSALWTETTRTFLKSKGRLLAELVSILERLGFTGSVSSYWRCCGRSGGRSRWGRHGSEGTFGDCGRVGGELELDQVGADATPAPAFVWAGKKSPRSSC